MLTGTEVQQLRPEATTPTSEPIELIHRPLPAFRTNDEAGRLEATARLDPPIGR
ncbi:hypothetical protein ACFW1M_34845 [Streptomyces inhibens]|uniref:hypothetical protein n=1 Tax=Streptomyces inhibens TaxID=2293571 RepID=UPI00367A8BA5